MSESVFHLRAQNQLHVSHHDERMQFDLQAA